MEYTEYLTTKHWLVFRAEAIDNAGRKCCLCSECRCLEVHHNNYRCLWREKFNDVAVLCRRCHEKVHDVMPEPPMVRVVEPEQTPVERISAQIERCKNPEKKELLEAVRFVYESGLSPVDMDDEAQKWFDYVVHGTSLAH